MHLVRAHDHRRISASLLISATPRMPGVVRDINSRHMYMPVRGTWYLRLLLALVAISYLFLDLLGGLPAKHCLRA